MRWVLRNKYVRNETAEVLRDRRGVLAHADAAGVAVNHPASYDRIIAGKLRQLAKPLINKWSAVITAGFLDRPRVDDHADIGPLSAQRRLFHECISDRV